MPIVVCLPGPAGGVCMGSGAAPVLLTATRSGTVESWHRGSLVLLGADGAVEVALGTPDRPVFARSCLKPLQVAAMVDAGYPGRHEQLALAAASHDGEPVHRQTVRAILAAAGLDEEALRCPPAWPGDEEARLQWVRQGGEPARICHNCSGKHAAMLATGRAAGWDTSTYLLPAHPLQVLIRETVARYAGEPVAATAVDGCGAPAHAISLVGLARSFAALSRAADGPARLVTSAMQDHPRHIGGTRRSITHLVADVPGLLAKDGAEAVIAASLPDGRSFAAKLDDGAARGLAPLLAAALSYWGFGARPSVRRWRAVPVTGGGEQVGELGWSADLRARVGPRASRG
ncbi:asparaginase [Frankia sp. CNm7]|uniref:Asparaginase n=1 Tax=Frankia nepalensis TaxID=1836974 RepID=A0A937UNB7_9ACTN|nr:asparaginase [Frankia nepalensis]MBL7498140.1 asparaginase [Frankia nepalensis]MBL7509342.1 asparaginase [Frankia nepalensis]MBL7516870.1 asparaginase [Frankia nepalensis]MBL7627928.1 asparaginase [Frankia nepalensis]